jgi:membrane fusion protein (multidrug efflux system)
MKKIITTLLISIIALLTLSACYKKTMPALPNNHVDLSIIHPTNIPYTFDYPAIVQGVIDYPVVPRISGALLKQLYVEGSYVKKGQALYQIDPRPYQLSLETFQGNLIRDNGMLINYKSIYNRAVNLYKIGAVAKQDVETAAINYKTAVGNVKTDQANIDNAKLNLEYCLVRAPADGYISQRQVTIGTMVNAFNTVLNQVTSPSDMYIQFSMPENDRLFIEQGILNKSIQVPANYKFNIDVQLADNSMLKNQGYVEFHLSLIHI